MPGPSSGRQARRPLSVRATRPAKRRGANARVRLTVGRFLLVGALLLAGVKLVQVQGFEAAELSLKAQQQRATPQDIPAERGAILDRNGNQLAFSIEARALYAVPKLMRKDWAELLAKDSTIGSFEDHAKAIGTAIEQVLGTEVDGQRTDERTMTEKLLKDTTYIELVENVEPTKAAAIRKQFNEIGSEFRAVRVYPNGSLASNVVGAANWRKDMTPGATHGQLGLESSQDNLLAGSNGRRVVDTIQGGDIVIPGADRDRELEPATPGKSLELTLDIDTQYVVQNMVTDYTAKSGAKSGSAVVLDSKTGEILAMANDKTFDPTQFGKATEDEKRNIAVTSVFEPGSVNKIITAAGAIEAGLYKPDEVLTVPGSIQVADRRISDAWVHGDLDMTFAGVFGKSSNVGTLMAAQRLGEERYAQLLDDFGLGKRTGSGLTGEEAGLVPPPNQWSGSTFGNLPIGQGLSMTLLQMTGMYQTMANDGVRVPPRIIRAEVDGNGARKEAQRPEGVRVVSPETAKTVREMFRSVVQSAPGQTGTGPAAALSGYQIAGKTGTAQQIDPNTGRYSGSEYWITFAGILPADNPRYVVGIVLDGPKGTPFSGSAAPLFHDIASYLAQRYQVPLSAEQSPLITLTP
jgi:cell division protein FtsI (penicillin-binding protein 3)